MTDHRIDLDCLPEGRTERLELARALFRRSTHITDGQAALRATYPNAPPAFLDTAAYHLYVELPDALLDMLAVLELTLKDPGRELGYAAPLHAIDHLYNWLQMECLLPSGVGGLAELAREAESDLAAGETESLKANLQALREQLEGFTNAPHFEAVK